MSALASAAEALFAAAWEARRRAYAWGLARPRTVNARVVSIGNLTLGGTGKTTLTLHLAAQARRDGQAVAVVCRRYHPGPGGRGDEEILYRDALGPEHVYAGSSKRDLATRAAADAHTLVLVDDGFSHWGLERDLDIVLLDAHDLWGGGRMIPAGRLREPRKALQRAEIVVISRFEGDEDLDMMLGEVARFAPAARLAVGRHRLRGLRTLGGAAAVAAGPARVVTATGNPRAVARSAREIGFESTELSVYRDHHWFSSAQAAREIERAQADGATLLLSAKDAVRWPDDRRDERIMVLDVEWSWVRGGAAVEQQVLAK